MNATTVCVCACVKYLCWYGSGTLVTQCLDHLEEVHHSFSLTEIKSNRHRTEDGRPSHYVAAFVKKKRFITEDIDLINLAKHSHCGMDMPCIQNSSLVFSYEYLCM